MKKLFPVLGAVALLGACVMPPEDVSDAELAAFDAAVASVGCDLVNESDYLPVELQTGLPREKVTQIGLYRVQLEQAVALEGGGLRLTTGACTPKEA